jgi:hypothetical protein
MGGVPESAPPAVGPGDEQSVAAPPAPEAPALAAGPAGAEHDAPEVSPDEVTVGPLPEGAVLLVDGVVAGDDDGVVAGDDDGVVAGDDDGVVAGVPAPDAAPAEQAVDPVKASPVVETLAVVRVVVPAPASAVVVAAEFADLQAALARTAPDITAKSRTHTASESRQILPLRRASDGAAKRTMC